MNYKNLFLTITLIIPLSLISSDIASSNIPGLYARYEEKRNQNIQNIKNRKEKKQLSKIVSHEKLLIDTTLSDEEIYDEETLRQFNNLLITPIKSNEPIIHPHLSSNKRKNPLRNRCEFSPQTITTTHSPIENNNNLTMAKDLVLLKKKIAEKYFEKK